MIGNDLFVLFRWSCRQLLALKHPYWQFRKICLCIIIQNMDDELDGSILSTEVRPSQTPIWVSFSSYHFVTIPKIVGRKTGMPFNLEKTARASIIRLNISLYSLKLKQDLPFQNRLFQHQLSNIFNRMKVGSSVDKLF